MLRHLFAKITFLFAFVHTWLILLALIILLGLGVLVFLDLFGFDVFGVFIVILLLFLLLSLRMIIKGSSGLGSIKIFKGISSSLGSDYTLYNLSEFISSSILSDLRLDSCIFWRY